MCEGSFYHCEPSIDLDTDINNVGSIALALYAQMNPEYDHVEASKWQAAQVSTLSIGNCAGRVVIGSTRRPSFLTIPTFHRSDFGFHTHPSPHPPCLLPMHRVVALHSLPDTRTQHFDRQRVVDRDDITGICIWKSVRDHASHHDRMVRSG